jgi:putative tryptophan/tyrosine transport system substrate-binding protein
MGQTWVGTLLKSALRNRPSAIPLGVFLLALCPSAHAQQPKTVGRIGNLTGASPAGVSARIEAFRQGLRELGYIEGENIIIG